MIQVTPQMRVLVAVDPVDFRRGIDGLACHCRKALSEDPMSGTVFVFRNRRGTGLRILVYDGQGFWLCYKRLSTGKFSRWPWAAGATRAIRAHQLHVLASAGDADAAEGAEPWRAVTPK